MSLVEIDELFKKLEASFRGADGTATGPLKTVAMHNPRLGLTIAIIRGKGVDEHVLLVHPETYARMAGITLEELGRRIGAGEIEVWEEEATDDDVPS